MSRMALSLFVMLSAGCAWLGDQPRMVFEKPGASQDQLKKDHTACMRTSVTGEDQVISNLLKLDRAIFRRCMEDRGYILRAQS